MAKLTYKEPIKVICVKTKNSKKLIKGAIYSATAIWTDTRNTKDRSIRIPAGIYSLDCFTSIDGKSLESEPDFLIEWKPTLDINKNYTNHCVRCKYSSGRTLKNGEIYYVEDQRTAVRNGWNGAKHLHIQVKIRGIKNWLFANNFEEMHITEQRKIKLENLIGVKIKTGEETRKFLLYPKNQRIQILFQLLNSSLIDINNAEFTEQIDISKLIINKGKQYDIIDEDVKPFINSLKTILKPFNFC